MARTKRTHGTDYGREHQTLRAKWTPLVATGRVKCWRCGITLHPAYPWDLGHDDHDRTKYRGPECLKCNRGTARKNHTRPIPKALKLFE